MSSKTTSNKKQYLAIGHAKHYAHKKKLPMIQAWLEQASTQKPLSLMQTWRLKQSLGESLFLQLDFSRIRTDKFAHESLSLF